MEEGKEGTLPTLIEIASLLEIEWRMRVFVKYVDEQAAAARARGMEHSPFAPGTLKLVEELRPLLKTIDDERADAAKPSEGSALAD